MLSALARRAVPATANRLSAAAAGGGARRAMGSAQSFVSFGAVYAAFSMRLLLSRGNRRWYSLHAHDQRFLPPRDPPCVRVLTDNWQLATGRWNQLGIAPLMFVCMRCACLFSIAHRSAIDSFSSHGHPTFITAAHRHPRQYYRDQVRFQRRELQTS